MDGYDENYDDYDYDYDTTLFVPDIDKSLRMFQDAQDKSVVSEESMKTDSKYKIMD